MRILNVELPVDQRQLVMLPADSKLLKVVIKGGLPYLYFMGDERLSREPRVFRIVCAGEHFNPEGWDYIDSFQLNDWFVGHLFEQPASGGARDEIDDRYAEDFAAIQYALREPIDFGPLVDKIFNREGE